MTQVKPIKRRRGAESTKAIRWNLTMAQREFGVHREQLERRRRGLAIEPGEDGCFTSRQIGALLFGDKEAEFIGKLAAERRKVELDNSRTEGEVIPTATAAKVAEAFLIPARQKILSSSMPDTEKDDVLADLVRLGDVNWQEEGRNASRSR